MGDANILVDRILFRVGPVPISRVIVVTWGVMGALVLLAAFIR